MHPANEVYWANIKSRYPAYFNGTILEVGSFNINGSVKDFLEPGWTKYVGLDWRPGPYVDVVSLAHEMEFPSAFGAVISASMLEHDPHWDKSIKQMIKYVRPDGILVLSWGSANSPSHCELEAPDGKFHNLKGELVKNAVEEAGFCIVELVYSKNLHRVLGCEPLSKDHFVIDGTEELNLVAFPSYFKDYAAIKKPVYIDDFLPEDRI